MYRILHEVLNWSKDEDFDTDIEEDIFEVFSHIDSKEATHANELKVCPFCGNEPDVEYKTDGKDWVRVVCPRCGGNSGWYMFESMAKDAWNRRFQE